MTPKGASNAKYYFGIVQRSYISTVMYHMYVRPSVLYIPKYDLASLAINDLQ